MHGYVVYKQSNARQMHVSDKTNHFYICADAVRII